VTRDPQAAAIGIRLRARFAQAKNELALEIAANLAKSCPVDTGHAKRNFIPSVTTPFVGEATGRAEYDTGVVQVLGATLAEPVFVANNVPYLKFLIGGSSDQQPPGWDVAAIDEAVATMQARYDGIKIDVSRRSEVVSARGGGAAENLASAYSPFGGDE
jgi:hypothetical protein